MSVDVIPQILAGRIHASMVCMRMTIHTAGVDVTKLSQSWRVGVDPKLVIIVALSTLVVCAVGAVYVQKTLLSIRNRGISSTLVILAMKIEAVLELFVPRTIWGERIGLRSVKSTLTDTEVEQVYQWTHDEEIIRWSAGSLIGLTLDEFRDQRRHDRWHPQSNQRVFYIVLHTGELIGKIGLYSIDWEQREGEMGIFLDKRYWSQKYGREAITVFERYVFSRTQINRIYLGTFKDNVRAQRSFASCGFHVVGSVARYNPILGEYADGVKMEVARQDIR
jgi:ribosomal-protein-alanine N-acetyltransferase